MLLQGKTYTNKKNTIAFPFFLTIFLEKSEEFIRKKMSFTALFVKQFRYTSIRKVKQKRTKSQKGRLFRSKTETLKRTQQSLHQGQYPPLFKSVLQELLTNKQVRLRNQ